MKRENIQDQIDYLIKFCGTPEKATMPNGDFREKLFKQTFPNGTCQYILAHDMTESLIGQVNILQCEQVEYFISASITKERPYK